MEGYPIKRGRCFNTLNTETLEIPYSFREGPTMQSINTSKIRLNLHTACPTQSPTKTKHMLLTASSCWPSPSFSPWLPDPSLRPRPLPYAERTTVPPAAPTHPQAQVPR